MDERGFEAEWPRLLYRRLKIAGLTEVGTEGHLAVRRAAAPGPALMPRTSRRCARRPSPRG